MDYFGEKIMSNFTSIDEQCVSTIRLLAADMVEQAKSGHPGMPLGAAPMAYVLFKSHIHTNPRDSHWFNRDRFVLSAGHGSALLYALLHLRGGTNALSLDDLKAFRQYQSLTPGHPEFGYTNGVDVSTGPLGQGFAMGVGMGLAERFLAARYNRDAMAIINHFTFAIVSDGDLMEGISNEAASFAGHQQLGKIIYLYDDNQITIEGRTEITCSENTALRFESLGWQVIHVENGNDLTEIDHAIHCAKACLEQPSLIIVKTHIGFGSAKQDLSSSHGAPLGKDVLAKTKLNFGFDPNESFAIPTAVIDSFSMMQNNAQIYYDQWNEHATQYQKKYSKEWNELYMMVQGTMDMPVCQTIPPYEQGQMIATRSASGHVINHIAAALPCFIGGSADLSPSNNTKITDEMSLSAQNNQGRNIHFGIREHAMGAIINGMAIYGGLLPFCATFLVFSDYMRADLRMAALMQSNSIFVFTHDSIGVGEDGPTHQPVEHIMSMRLIPGLTVIRPADANETIAAWQQAMLAKGPTALILTRQNVVTLMVDFDVLSTGVSRGAYVVWESERNVDVLAIATGSEVYITIEAAKIADEQGVGIRVISMPSWELFLQQDLSYQNDVLPAHIIKRISVEAGSTTGWQRFVGLQGITIGIDAFGLSAPADQLMAHFELTKERILKAMKIVS